MPRKSVVTTKNEVNDVSVNADTSLTKEVNNEDVTIVENKNKKSEVKNVEPLRDDDEIAVESLIPNVSYKDLKSGDMYEWDDVGHIEYMTFDTLKNMSRSYKNYFKNMWIRPNDERVIKKLGLVNTYDKYDFIMDENNYTSSNIKNIIDTISSTPNGLKFSVCNKIKNMVSDGVLTDISVIKSLDEYLKLDLISFA